MSSHCPAHCYFSIIWPVLGTLSHPSVHYCSVKAFQCKARGVMTIFWVLGSLMYVLKLSEWAEKVNLEIQKLVLQSGAVTSVYYIIYTSLFCVRHLLHDTDKGSVSVTITVYLANNHSQHYFACLQCKSITSHTNNNSLWPFEFTAIPQEALIVVLVFCYELQVRKFLFYTAALALPVIVRLWSFLPSFLPSLLRQQHN